MHRVAEAAPGFVFARGLANSGDHLDFEPEEARYLVRVVRARDGERLHATDGAGCVARILVERVRPTLELRVESREQRAPLPRTELLCGAPEGERGDWLVEKCAELGVTRLVPVDCARAQWTDAKRADRWRRLAVAALKQSRSAWLMECSPVAPLETALASLEPGERWLADAGGSPAQGLDSAGSTPVTGVVGPSIGFSGPERNLLLEKGFVPVRLASTRLRAETAAVALAALWAERRARAAGGAA